MKSYFDSELSALVDLHGNCVDSGRLPLSVSGGLFFLLLCGWYGLGISNRSAISCCQPHWFSVR